MICAVIFPLLLASGGAAIAQTAERTPQTTTANQGSNARMNSLPRIEKILYHQAQNTGELQLIPLENQDGLPIARLSMSPGRCNYGEQEVTASDQGSFFLIQFKPVSSNKPWDKDYCENLRVSLKLPKPKGDVFLTGEIEYQSNREVPRPGSFRFKY